MCLRLFALEGRPRVYMRVEGSAILCEKVGGGTISCVQVAVFEGTGGGGRGGGGREDMSALCVGTPRSSLLIHCSPAPTNR